MKTSTAEVYVVKRMTGGEVYWYVDVYVDGNGNNFDMDTSITAAQAESLILCGVPVKEKRG
jgi:hypothetical protein